MVGIPPTGESGAGRTVAFLNERLNSAIEAVNLGVAGYLVKPFRVPQLLSVVERAFGNN